MRGEIYKYKVGNTKCTRNLNIRARWVNTKRTRNLNYIDKVGKHHKYTRNLDYKYKVGKHQTYMEFEI